MSTEELMEDLTLTPSSSCVTVCLDETESKEEETNVKVSNVFKRLKISVASLLYEHKFVDSYHFLCSI